MNETEKQETQHDPQRAACTVSLVADFNRRYPGEDVTFYARVIAHDPIPGFRLTLSLPEGLAPGITRAPGGALPRVGLGAGTRYLVWHVERTPGTEIYEYQVTARVEPTLKDLVLRSRATVTAGDDEEEYSGQETVSIRVLAKGEYLKHLPALYQRDELMGRFLMLFQSFWDPIESQIEHLPLYFDPRMTPPDFMPWLASWLGLVMDDQLPERQRRQLIRSAVSLYRKRGTKGGLLEYLEVLGEKAQIDEHRSSNFTLGSQGRLGPGIALGTRNLPHTFTITLRPPSTLPPSRRRQMVTAVIDAVKPAHAGYVLRIEDDQPASQMEG